MYNKQAGLWHDCLWPIEVNIIREAATVLLSPDSMNVTHQMHESLRWDDNMSEYKAIQVVAWTMRIELEICVLKTKKEPTVDFSNCGANW